ncbi:hypothetical protein QYE76_065972 [Lolium multiflorum]|uniref:Uncharacterized protein n=1 Tax=Lolium multiflorum TaxID=4521 RepID=A0AAD8WBN3_LOLMU|nr:hypothetical protein QYE76_065972 [Lolium multiflorum]
MLHLMNEVWGNPEAEEQMMSKLEGEIKVFFAQHKHVRQNTRKLHEDLRVHVLEQKVEIEGLRQSYTDSQKVVSILETRVKNYEEEIAKRPSIDALSTQLEVLKAENESLKKFLKESSEKETKKKKELVEKHAQEMADLDDKLSKGITKSLSLKRAGTTLIDTMTKLMRQVPELIKDWQESSSRGVASLTLAMCKAHFPTMNFADVARGAPKGTNIRAALAETQGYDRLFAGRVNHSFWYNKYDLPEGFSDAEDEEEEGVEEGSGSSANHSKEGSGEDSGDGSAYVASEDDHSSE